MAWTALQLGQRGKCDNRDMGSMLGSQGGCGSLSGLGGPRPEIHPWEPRPSSECISDPRPRIWARLLGLPGSTQAWPPGPLTELPQAAFKPIPDPASGSAPSSCWQLAWHHPCFSPLLEALDSIFPVRCLGSTLARLSPKCSPTTKQVWGSGAFKPGAFHSNLVPRLLTL